MDKTRDDLTADELRAECVARYFDIFDYTSGAGGDVEHDAGHDRRVRMQGRA